MKKVYVAVGTPNYWDTRTTIGVFVNEKAAWEAARECETLYGYDDCNVIQELLYEEGEKFEEN